MFYRATKFSLLIMIYNPAHQLRKRKRVKIEYKWARARHEVLYKNMYSKIPGEALLLGPNIVKVYGQ